MFPALLIFSTFAYCCLTTNAEAEPRDDIDASIASPLNYAVVEELVDPANEKTIRVSFPTKRGLFDHFGHFGSGLSSLSDLLPGAGGGNQAQQQESNGLELTVPPMSCRIKRFDGLHFNGQLTGVSRGVDSANLCAAECWVFRKRGRKCDSVNFMQRKKTCELRVGILQNQYSDSASRQYDSVYMIPLSCEPASGSAFGGNGGSGWSSASNGAWPWSSSSAATGSSPVSSATASGSGRCGRTYYEPNINLFAGSRFKRSKQRIVGGSEAVAHSFPSAASLQQGSSHYCGATLVRVSDKVDESDIVITAAHCLAERPFDLNVVLGAHEMNSANVVRVKAAAYRPHGDYDSKRTINDIGMVKLAKPVAFNEHIQPACLPEQDEGLRAGEYGAVIGWGTLKEGRIKLPGHLMQVAVPVVDDYSCSRYYPSEVTLKYMFCAGYDRGGKDSCQGDSGGPLLFKGAVGWTLRGVVSFGEGCARARKPGVYTRVAYYRNWIEKNIRELTSVRV